ncbi:MAG: thiol reductant ABC exporter subunit CydD, partial [Actinomycetota bacterium]|nr:thiol reductant ABC exporter subunit CydD [Actinomycetota bacterium]
MKPLDPRLVRRAPSVRQLLAGATVLAGISAAAIVVQAVAVADLLAAALGTDRTPGFTAELCWLAAAIVVRAAAAWGSEELAGRAAGSAAGQLRQEVLA